MTGPMAITVSTIVVVTAWITLRVTNKLASAMQDVTRDILMMTVTKVYKLADICLICFLF